MAEAHASYGDAVSMLERGLDPGAKAVQERQVTRTAPNLTELAELYLEKWAKPRKKSWREDERVLRRDVLPTLGHKKARAVTRRDINALLDATVARGAEIQANRTLALVRKMFNFALSRDLVDTNPCNGVSAPAAERRRDRVLSEDEIGAVLANLRKARMSGLNRLAVKLQLLTAQRCGEVLNAEWSEFDLEQGWWTIPAEKAKNKLTHRVPLSAQALAVLAQAKRLSPDTSFVFASPRGDRAMTPTALALAVRRNLETFEVERFTPHDLRRTAASQMTSMGISRLVVSKLLNHAESGVTAVYDRHSYDQEKRAALVAWGEKVGDLMGEASPVIDITRALA